MRIFGHSHLPTHNESKGKKIIAKFTRRDVCNQFYGKRKAVAGKHISRLSALDISSYKVYISESLTASRKKLFGAANRMKKKTQMEIYMDSEWPNLSQGIGHSYGSRDQDSELSIKVRDEIYHHHQISQEEPVAKPEAKYYLRFILLAFYLHS